MGRAIAVPFWRRVLLTAGCWGLMLGWGTTAAETPAGAGNPQAVAANAALEGAVIDITGPQSIQLGEAIAGSVRFARVTQPHVVTVRWVDTKGRICAELSQGYAPPVMAVNYKFQLAQPLGTNHRIEALVDGKAQPVSHGFFVQRPYAPWVDYQASVWAHYDQGFMPRLREAGINSSIYTGKPTTDCDFSFYPDNICYEVFAYYHKRKDEDAAIHAAQFKTPHNAVLFHRRPSLTDEGTWDKVRDRLLKVVDEVKGYRPLYYNVADEIGISDQSQPSDMDWEYSSRDGWRSYLERKYGTLERLNAEWGTTHESWGRVRAFFPQTHAMYYQLWRDNLLPAAFEDIAGFNQKFGTAYADFGAVVKGYRAICTDDAGMRLEGLKENYKKIEDLNEALGTKFETHEQAARYVADFEAWVGQQHAGDTRNWNLSWWCDFRDYMDEYMAGGLKRACDIGRAADPGGRFGITGTHHPGVFSGHNYAKILEGIDCIIPYDIGQSFELIRGFKPDFYYMHPTWASGEKLQRDLWYYFLHGCRGVLFWDNDEPKNKLLNKATGALTERGLAAQPVLNEITAGIDRLLLQSRREHNGVAIYHSQASVRVAWWHSYVKLGRRWMTRRSWNEYGEDECSVLRTSWIKLLEDNHLQFIFVSPEQVAAGRLQSEGIRVLVLPEVWALSDDEAAAIRQFVEAGGTAVADQYLGLYDEHGKRRATGALDFFFGVDQGMHFGDRRKGTAAQPVETAGQPLPILADLGPGLKQGTLLETLNTGSAKLQGVSLRANSGAKALAGTAQNAAVVVRSARFDPAQPGQAGIVVANAVQPPAAIRGETVFLNVDVSRYSQTRMTDAERTEKLVALVRAALPPDVQPGARVVNAGTGARESGTEVGVWNAGGGRRLIAVWHNIQMRKEGIGGEAFTDNTMFEKPVAVKVLLDREQHVVDQRSGKDFGRTAAVEITLDPWHPVILTCQDQPFQKPTVHAPAEVKAGETLTFAVQAPGAAVGALQVFRLNAVDPNGQAVWYYTQKADTRGGAAGAVRFTVPLALNELRGAWQWTVTDTATQATVAVSVRVQD